MKIMLASLREERQQTYSCFLPIHPETGRVMYVPMKHVDPVNHTITFDDEDGREWTLPVTGGNVKLQWKPDFGARWAALDVDFEMYGKDHSTNTPIYDGICEVLGGKKPNHMSYELFLDDQGQKISKSKGNGLTIDEWLTYASTESLSYFMYQKPKTAKRMHFDVIPRAMDEYHQQLRAYPTQDIDQQVNNPVWHIHNGNPPRRQMVVPFSMLLNLASVSAAQGCQGPVGLYQALCARCLARGQPRSGCRGGLCGALFRRPDCADARVPSAIGSGARRDARPARAAGARGRVVWTTKRCKAWSSPSARSTRFEPLRDWFKALV